MTLFAIFEPKDGKTKLPAAIPETFSWLAAVLPPVYALVHGLWLELIAFVVAVVLLGFATTFIGGDAAVLIYLLFALWIGLAAPSIRRHALSWRGWRHRTDLVATDPDLARLSWMEKQ